MTTHTFAISVGTKVKQLVAANSKRKVLLVANLGTEIVYVLSKQPQKHSDGFPVLPAESPEYGERLNLSSIKDALWVVSETDTNDVRVMVSSE